MHTLLELIFVCFIGVLFTLFIVHRPRATQPQTKPTKAKLAGLFVLGAIIGVVFLTTTSLYVTPTTF